jgi:proteasome assembly chaperone (PAC2) family protein
MDSVIWASDPPELRSPILVASFSGWNDAASAASTAIGALAAASETELIARIDPEEFFDFQANRPIITLTEGRVRDVEWPSNEIYAAAVPDADRDLLVINGTEPSGRWRTFCSTLLDLAERCDVESMISLGSLIADVAHTRPVPVTGLATDGKLVERLGFEDVAYEGPTGIVGVLHNACRERGISAASLWAAVPHYAAAVPNPKAALALIHQFENLIDVVVDATELEEAAIAFEDQVSEAVEANPEIKEMVERLEAQQDEVAEFSEEVPSGDAIARDFQRFLRQQGE